MKIGAVEDTEAFADVAQADALDIDVRHFFFGDTHAVVFDFDAQAAVAVCSAQLNFSAVELGRQAVFQAIFDDGLEKHAGTKASSVSSSICLMMSRLSRPKRATSISR